jgi:non-specific serine/threonine protein kinase
MAYVYIQYLELGLKPEPRYLEQAEEYANRALRVRSDSVPGHVARGMVRFKRGDIEGAVPDLKRALQTDPTDRDALFRLALIYLIAGREAAAEPLLERLLEIDPLTAVNHCLPGYAEFLRGKIEDAIPAYRRMLQLDPGSPVTRWFLALVLARCRRDTEALQLLDEIIRDTPYTTFARHARFLSGSLREDRNAALAAVTPQLLAEARWDQHASWWMASTYALIDERDAALDWLRNATKLGYINYPFLSQYDPFLDSLRGDGRFWVLMEEVKGRWERFAP